MLSGIGISPGIVLAKAKVKKEHNIEIIRESIKDINAEIDRFHEAIECSKKQIKEVRDKTLAEIGEKEARIFDAHELILEDVTFTDQVINKIKDCLINSESAIKEVSNNFIAIFNNMDDAYMKEKASDIKDVTERVIYNLLGIEQCDFNSMTEEVIVVSKDLTPSDTASFNKDKVLGFITEFGGKTSHTAILARTLEIPAVTGINDLLQKIKDDDFLIIDGNSGQVIVNPDNEVIKEYEKKKSEYEKQLLVYKKYKDKKTISKDGINVELVANIGMPSDIKGVLNNGAEGIGLFRTEFLFMDRDRLPTEEEQFQAYKEVVQKMGDKPVVIRTIDIGGDKEVPYLCLPAEMNPFLGYRAIRMCLDRQDMFRTQLRALLRASNYGNLKIMFPMISNIDEIQEAKKILEEIRVDLRNNGILFNENIEIGMMIEIPSAAIMSDIFAKEVDFFSIGSNDLIQYTVAVDRGNDKIASLYDEFNPAVLRLINTIIKNAHNEGIWVGMCGEAASNTELIPILLAMGLDEFSMNASSLLQARYLISQLSVNDIKQELPQILQMQKGKQIQKYISKITNIRK
ncbi:phosphoenolpyruvate--protein phosphotransferase [Vallitalea guaymasensis]|uniref:phosphoenolpyruvate--protein phosphotransferase n=1 Tax=Vallitalea guaymasensis TaxID=1185412 RepID=UPI002729A22A|nr:phosphoenolpyruvate--protein phosphotransferase [Vallitalea guaymasensis]